MLLSLMGACCKFGIFTYKKEMTAQSCKSGRERRRSSLFFCRKLDTVWHFYYFLHRLDDGWALNSINCVRGAFFAVRFLCFNE